VTVTRALLTRRRVLADHLSGGLVRDVLLVVGYAVLIGLSAQVVVRLPFTPVPLTGLTFGVLAGALALGWWRSALGMALYLFAGLAGVPWFAGGAGGPATLLAPSFGYIIGCLAASALVGRLAERGFDRRPLRALVAMVAGSAVIYAFGLPWLAFTVHSGPATTLALGLYPFLIGDALKAALAAGVLPGARWLVHRME
jgi:biotin transport system substrate-specific component